MKNDEDNVIEDLYEELESIKKKSYRSNIIILSLIFIAILLASYYYYAKIYKKISRDIPIFSADKDDFKVRPKDPGGMVVANMDKTIYDNFSQKPNKDLKEKLLPQPEEPIDRMKYFGIKAEDDFLEKILIEKEEEPKPVIKKIAKEKGYTLQLAAFKSYKVAGAALEKIKKKHEKLVKSYQIFIDKKDIEYNKQFYRLQIGPIVNESEARLLCKKLKNDGQDCMIIKP